MIKLFLNFELSKISKYFRTRTLAKSITSFLFVLIFLGVGLGIYQFFVVGFRSINAEAVEDIRLALTLFLYEIFLIILAGIIFFSSMVSGVFNLWGGKNDNWIICTPNYNLFPKIVFIKNLMRSLLPTFILFLPMILAFNKVYSLGLISLGIITVSVVFFLIFINAMTLSFVELIALIYYKVSQKTKLFRFSLKGLIILLSFIIGIIFTILWRVITTVDLIKLFKASDVSNSLSVINISNHFVFLPTHPFAMEIINLQNNHLGYALYYFSIISLLTILVVFLWWKLSFLYYVIWQKLQEGSTKSLTNKGFFGNNKLVYQFTGNKTMVLFKKEMLISSRNMKGVLWFLFLLFLWLIQIGTNIVLNTNIERYQTDISPKLATLQALQFIIAVYFISSFTLRFVFPSFSVEKKTAWILGSAPLNFTRIFFGKYFFYTSFFVILGIFMSSVNINALGLSAMPAFYLMMLFIPTVIFIVTFGLTLGALFPNFETDDPEIISTSMPGLFFTAISLICGALGAWILYITLIKNDVTWLLLFVTITTVLTGLILIYTPILVKKKIFF